MKLALCLSGQPRSFKAAHEYIKRNLLDVRDVDVFIHSWKPNGVAKSLQIYEDLNELYQPKYLKLDSPLPENVNNHMFVPNASHPANHVTSMLYSIYRSNDYRIIHELSKGIKYDYVIRCRLDFALNTQIHFESLLEGTAYVPKDAEGVNLLNDQFAISDPNTMNLYASTLLNVGKLSKFGIPLCGHQMICNNLILNNVKIEHMDVNHPFVDGKYNIGKHSIIRDDMSQWIDPKIWGY